MLSERVSLVVDTVDTVEGILTFRGFQCKWNRVTLGQRKVQNSGR